MYNPKADLRQYDRYIRRKRAALALALDAANKHGLDIVVSTTGGGTVRPCWKWPGKGAIPAGSWR